MDGKIIRNSLLLFAGQVCSKIIALIYTIFLIRNLTPDNFGLYIVATSYFSLISSVSDFGVSRFLIRQASKNKNILIDILINIVILRFTLVVIIFVIFALLILHFDPEKTRVSLVLVAVLAILPQSIAMIIDSVFVALQKFTLSVAGFIVLAISSFLIGVTLITQNFGVMGAVSSIVLGQIVYAIFLATLLSQQKIHFLGSISLKAIKEISIGSLPYGVIAVLGLLYFKIDAILLSYIKGSYDTGIYGAAFKFLEAIVFVPSAVAIVLFPVLSKLHENGIEKVKQLYFKSLKIMGGVSILILLLYLLIIPQLIKLILPGYLSSINSVIILSFAIPFMFIHVPAAIVLLSSDKFLKPVILMSIMTLVFNITMNLLLIPPLGFIGASWVTVLSEVLSFIIFFVFLQTKVFR